MRKTPWGIIGILLAVLFVSNQYDRHERAQAKAQADADEAARMAALTPEQRQAEENAKAERAQRAQTEAVEASATRAKRESQYRLAALGAADLKSTMKDPQAFELNWLYVLNDGTACFKYRATNSLGAHLASEAVMTGTGKMLLQERQPSAFVALWNKECTQGGGDEISSTVKRLGLT